MEGIPRIYLGEPWILARLSNSLPQIGYTSNIRPRKAFYYAKARRPGAQMLRRGDMYEMTVLYLPGGYLLTLGPPNPLICPYNSSFARIPLS